MGILKFVGKQFKEVGDAIADGFNQVPEESEDDGTIESTSPTTDDILKAEMYGMNCCHTVEEHTRRLLVGGADD